MKTINRDTECLLEDGEVVIVEKGSNRIPCVVRKCGPCSSCVLWEEDDGEGIECDHWKSTTELNGHTYAAAFVPIEEAVE